MHVYHFSEATPLIKFIDEKKDRIIGGTLKRLDTLYWPTYERANISELPVILFSRTATLQCAFWMVGLRSGLCAVWFVRVRLSR